MPRTCCSLRATAGALPRERRGPQALWGAARGALITVVNPPRTESLPWGFLLIPLFAPTNRSPVSPTAADCPGPSASAKGVPVAGGRAPVSGTHGRIIASRSGRMVKLLEGWRD